MHEASSRTSRLEDVQGEIAAVASKISGIEAKLEAGGLDHDDKAFKEKMLLQLREEKNLLLQKELKLMDQQSAGAKEAVGEQAEDASEEAACVRAFKRSKASEKKALSEVSDTDWRHISRAYGLTCEPGKPLLPDVSSEAYEVFSWDGRPENQQTGRYMRHLQRLIPFSSRTSFPLAWLEGGDRNKGLLNYADYTDSLYFGQISGNVDVAIVTQASLDCFMPEKGLCVLFELKKRVERKSMAQGWCQLLLANLHSQAWRPVVVVTDLVDVWNLLYVDASALKASPCSRGAAVSIIRALVGAAVLEAAPGTACERAPAVPDVLASRQPLPLVSSVVRDDRLADLEGLLPDEELKAAQGSMMVQQLLKLPICRCIAESQTDPPSQLYT